MKLYFAPLEGIATHTYRRVHKELFGDCDQYFSPFITPTENEKLGGRAVRDILPENNVNVPLYVQLLSNNSRAFLSFLPTVSGFGYDRVNLNFGCPSSTVVKKGRGAGILKDTDALEKFLWEIFEKTEMKISVKTRIGFFSGEEADGLIDIYNKFPLEFLVVHPRAREDYYNGVPDMETFSKFYERSNAPLCYNGNIFTKEDFEKIAEDFPRLDSIMIGRGALRNPAIFREIQGGRPISTEELVSFSRRLEKEYLAVLGSEVYTLHKLKELWMYMMQMFPEERKLLKRVKKSNKLTDLFGAIESLPEL